MEEGTLSDTRALLRKYEAERLVLQNRLTALDASIVAMKAVLGETALPDSVAGNGQAVPEGRKASVATARKRVPRPDPVGRQVREALASGSVATVDELVVRLKSSGCSTSPSTAHRKLQAGVRDGAIAYDGSHWSLAASTS